MPAVLIHGGSGPIINRPPKDAERCRAVLHEALAGARTMLEEGRDALDAVQGAVCILEACDLFNAGHGAALCSDGSAELSAAVMRGSDRAAGAVAGIRQTKHPVLAAESVLRSDQVLMIGASADEQAAQRGAEQVPNSYFVTDRQRNSLRAGLASEAHGTVGAVCLDHHGTLAAATSTGGITGQPPGRVGDSPLIGAGTWADDRVAVSCTGDGEAFIRVGAARHLATLVQEGAVLEHAGRAVLSEIRRLGGRGGLIALDVRGHSTMPFVTEALARGSWRSGGHPEVAIA